MDTIFVRSGDDWGKLRATLRTPRSAELTAVVDPMVYRTADLFLQGGSALPEKHRDQVWWAISQNIGALMLFFDSVILHDRLPIFSYWTTFPEGTLVGHRLAPEMLQPVVVTDTAGEACQARALPALHQHPRLSQRLERAILSELTAYQYEWRPELNLPQDVDERTRRLQTFLYGGYLFSEFAEQLAAARQPDQPPTEHLWQPKRSRLYLAAELRASQRLFKQESTIVLVISWHAVNH